MRGKEDGGAGRVAYCAQRSWLTTLPAAAQPEARSLTATSVVARRFLRVLMPFHGVGCAATCATHSSWIQFGRRGLGRKAKQVGGSARSFPMRGLQPRHEVLRSRSELGHLNRSKMLNPPAIKKLGVVGSWAENPCQFFAATRANFSRRPATEIYKSLLKNGTDFGARI